MAGILVEGGAPMSWIEMPSVTDMDSNRPSTQETVVKPLEFRSAGKE